MGVPTLAEDRRSSDGAEAATFRWDAADVAKFAMSIMVVAIHINPFGHIGAALLTPLLRLAVPLFFTISSYLFFRRLGGGASWCDARSASARFFARTARLYLFWFFVLLVPTCFIRGWNALPILDAIAAMVRAIPFHATFLASWYLSASVIALYIIVVFRYRLGMPRWALCLLGVGCYVAALLASGYSWTIGSDGYPFAISGVFSAANSFVIAVPWMGLGAAVASWERKGIRVMRRGLVAAAFLGVTVLYLEWLLLHLARVEMIATDVFVCLPFAAVPLFLLLCSCRLQVSCARDLRAASTVIYCLHATLGQVYAALFRMIGIVAPGPVLFALTLGSCFIVAVAIIQLGKLPGFRWLKNAC